MSDEAPATAAACTGDDSCQVPDHWPDPASSGPHRGTATAATCSHGPGCPLPWSLHDWSYEADHATAASIPYEGTDCTADEAVEAVEAVRATAAKCSCAVVDPRCPVHGWVTDPSPKREPWWRRVVRAFANGGLPR